MHSLDPQEKKMYLVVIFGAGMLVLPIAGDALPGMGGLLFPLATISAVGFVASWMTPVERLFPLRSLPRRASPLVWDWTVYVFKAVLFFGGISLSLYAILQIFR